MKMEDIKIGMNFSEVRKQLNKTDNLIMDALPTFTMSAYDEVRNLDTKEKLYVLKDYETDTIIDVTSDFNKAVDNNKANECLREILENNGYLTT